MKRLLERLRKKFSGASDVSTALSIKAPRRPRTDEAGKAVSMPDIYADAHDATEPNLEIHAPLTPDADESAGFNPYDTGVLQKK